MILEDLKKLKTGDRDLRKFGLVVGAVLALLAAWCWWRGKPGYPYFAVAAVPLLVLGSVWPRGLKWIYLPWMAVGITLGLIVSTVLLTVFYYLVVTPLGLLSRAMGKDFLSLKIDRAAATYWIPRNHSEPKPRRSYEQQF